MIGIVNSGTQPELRHLAKYLQESRIDFQYFTASSVGNDWLKGKLGALLSTRKSMKKFLGRRTIPISEANIKRHLFIVSLFIRVMPRKIRQLALRIRNKLHLFLVFVSLGRSEVSIAIIQDHIPWYWRYLKRRMIFVLILSNATPHYVLDVMKREIKLNASRIEFFGRSIPCRRELKSFENACFLADKIVVPSSFVKSSFHACNIDGFEGKVHVIRLGFDQSLFSQSIAREKKIERVSTEQPLEVIFVGQICGRKGVGYLAKAFHEADLPSGSTLTLVGTSVNGFAEYLISIFPRIIHINFTNQWELCELYRNYDLFVMPSLIEGFCLSAIEAMASGIAVLVSPETIDNVETHLVDGLTVRSGDVDSLKRNLEWAARNPSELSLIAKKGESRARQFTWDCYGEKLTAYLRALEK